MSSYVEYIEQVNEAVEAVIRIVNGLGLFANMTRGALPTTAGLTCEIAPSAPETVFMNKGLYLPLDLTINGKHSDLQVLNNAMWILHMYLTQLREYPAGAFWEIVDITTNTMPSTIGREKNNDWLMASSLSVKLYLKGD